METPEPPPQTGCLYQRDGREGPLTEGPFTSQDIEETDLPRENEKTYPIPKISFQ